MSVVTLRLNGMLARGRDNNCSVSFEGKAINLELLLTVIKAEVPEKAIAFIAINGTKVFGDSLIQDGDILDIYPVVAGG